MADKTETLNGAEILIRCLEAEGTRHLFGYPGGAVLHIYDALYKQDKVRHILTRHEQGAVHAADGYARSTGKPGVALVTSGPGATNAVTGIATAYMDSSPLVVITGQVPTALIGNDAFQEVDAVGITRPCTKHNFLVKDANDLALTIKKAFYVATTGRPGPVVVDIPKDVTAQCLPFNYPRAIDMRSYKPMSAGHPGQIRKAANLILSAKRPVIYSGGGVILGNAAAQLTELTRLLGYPITQTMMGLGGYPATDKQFLGMLGMHGTYEANMAMHECDVLIAIGARFDDRVTGDVEKFCPLAKVIHIDVDPSSIAKNIPVHIPIVGAVDRVLTDLVQTIKNIGKQPDQRVLNKWWEQINRWREKNSLHYDRHSNLVKPQFVVEKLYEVTRGDAFIASDVGQHQMWTSLYYKFDKPRRWISSGGLGTMGFGLPAALGVQMAHPEAQVACVTGDGSIQMCIQELSTAKQHDLPVKIICLNNGYLGMVRQWQEFFYDRRYAHTYLESLPDFAKLAESYGHIGIKVDKPAEVEPALREAFSMKDRLVFVNCITDHTENVYPMVAAGKGQHEMLLPPITSDPHQERELA
ncbi:MAG: biosynthetic-type acetolactate synthase large subunit [Gammaproteobacteria bacterium]|nr:biosynthetic-type acetolactate synthase large subunit [Gammaproteobacteria bacterium]